MKRLLFMLILGLSAWSTAAQEGTEEEAKAATGLQIQPVYPGSTSFQQYVASYLKGMSFKKSQKIIVSVVEKDGSLTNTEFSEGAEKKIKKKIQEALKESVRWSPGIQNGKPVRVRYSFPVNIKVSD